ncbi:MAG: hypothetical protein P8X92_07230 [Dehalococcoidia bacterium]
MKTWKIALVSVLTRGLVLGAASPALAAPPWASPPTETPTPPRMIRGEVVSIADASFVVKTGWSEVTVLVDDETAYFKTPKRPGAFSLELRVGETAEPSPEGLGLRLRLHRLVDGVPTPVRALVQNRLEVKEQVREELRLGRLLSPVGEEATFADIEVASWVSVWGVAEGDNLVARRIVIMEPVAYHLVVGSVTGLDSENITITTDAGEIITLSYDEETRIILRGSISLEVGQQVRAVYDEEGVARLVVVVTGSD